jgi:2-iminobutanoate/2-iminopropanoate deaminase
MKDIIVTDKAPKAIGPYSQAVRANGFLFITQIALDPNTNTLLEGDVAQQNGTRAGIEGDSHAR